VGGVALFAVALALAGSSCGGGSTHTAAGPRAAAHTDSATAAAAKPAVARPAQFLCRRLYWLSAPLRDPASAVLGSGHFALLGGLDATDSSSAGIELADLHGVLHTVSLPLAQHDAEGAQLGGVVYVFGGGSFSELDHIVRFDPVRDLVHSVGVLPRAQSDVAVTASDGTAYVVGGYDGTN
jgi:hypothetical protein